jgi:DsbC/DsbD-like thiol-disulfide interchange protein
MVVLELGIRHVMPKFILLVIASFLYCSATAQSSTAASKVGLMVKLSRETPHPGSEISATVLVTIAEGWHINSSAPLDENLIATSLSFQTVPGVAVADVRFPAAEERLFGFSDAPVEVYEGTIPIEASVRIGANLKPGTYTIPVVLTYQACNDNVCLAPTSVRTEMILTVAPMK